MILDISNYTEETDLLSRMIFLLDNQESVFSVLENLKLSNDIMLYYLEDYAKTKMLIAEIHKAIIEKACLDYNIDINTVNMKNTNIDFIRKEITI